MNDDMTVFFAELGDRGRTRQIRQTSPRNCPGCGESYPSRVFSPDRGEAEISCPKCGRKELPQFEVDGKHVDKFQLKKSLPDGLMLLPKDSLFKPGDIFITPGAVALLKKKHIRKGTLLVRHLSGDWGDIPDEDRQQNDRAIKGGLIQSVYDFQGERVWVMTEAGHSRTTILLPDEY